MKSSFNGDNSLNVVVEIPQVLMKNGSFKKMEVLREKKQFIQINKIHSLH